MKIIRFFGVNIFGYLTRQVNFNDDINILVGINGSGKTSIMQLINWMLSPDIDTLCNIDFELVEIEIEKDNEKLILKCTQNSELLLYEVIKNGKQMPPLKVSFKQFPKNRDFIVIPTRRLSPEPEEMETYSFVSKLGKLTLIGIDRELNKQQGTNRINLERDYERLLEDDEKIPPMVAVQNIIRLQVNNYRMKVLNYNKQLRDKIIESVFTDIGYSKKNLWKELNTKLPLIEERFKVFLKKYAVDLNAARMTQYFNELVAGVKSLSMKASDDEKKRLIEKYNRIVGVLNIFEEYEGKSNSAYELLSNYLRELNKFMCDSGKEIVIKDNSIELSFNILLEKNISKESRNVNFLSSGEKQLIILLTYITFSSENEVILIDEPELSLHPLWQENFMDSLKQLLPSTTQVILATHSPALVGKNRKYCKIISRG